jgi:hypothetical protein
MFSSYNKIIDILLGDVPGSFWHVQPHHPDHSLRNIRATAIAGNSSNNNKHGQSSSTTGIEAPVVLRSNIHVFGYRKQISSQSANRHMDSKWGII